MAKNGNIHPTRIFETPEQLYASFQEYKEDLKEQAKEWLKIQYVGKEGEKKEDPYKLPMSFDGYCVFCFPKYGTVKQYFANKDNLYTNFVDICSHIRQEIRANQITGGLLGVYNPSITQRLNNLVEKTEDVTPQQPKKLVIKIKRDEDS